MRIFYYNRLINEPFGGGSHARGLVAGMEREGHQVLTYPAVVEGGAFSSTVGRYTSLPEFVRVPGMDIRSRVRVFRETPSLERLVRAWQPEVIVARRAAYDYTLDGLVATRDAPLVAEMNALLSYEAGKYSRERFLPWETRREIQFAADADVVACVSESVHGQLLAVGVEAGRLLVIPNGVDEVLVKPETMPTNAADSFRQQWKTVIAYCGTISAHHDAVTLARAAARIAAADASVGFLWAGPSREELIAAGFDASVLNRSLITGRIRHSQVVAHLVVADVAWAAFRNDEGSPLKLLEYLCLGKPVLACGGGQIESTLRESGGGLTFAKGDAKALADGFVFLTADGDRMRAFGQRGRAWVLANATWASVAQRMLERVK